MRRRVKRLFIFVITFILLSIFIIVISVSNYSAPLGKVCVNNL